MCASGTDYERFGREVERWMEQKGKSGDRFAFRLICLRADVRPSKINRVLESELGLNGDALMKRLLF